MTTIADNPGPNERKVGRAVIRSRPRHSDNKIMRRRTSFVLERSENGRVAL